MPPFIAIAESDSIAAIEAEEEASPGELSPEWTAPAATLRRPASAGRSFSSAAEPESTDRWFRREILPMEPAIRRYLRRQFLALVDADDVVQESYLRLFRLKQDGRLVRSSRSLIFTIARNLVLDQLRRQRRSPFAEVSRTVVEEFAENRPDAAELTARRQEAVFLRQAIANLPNRCRTALELYRLHDLTARDTAARMGISAKTVEKHVARAMDCCALYFEERGLGRRERPDSVSMERPKQPAA